MKQVVYPHREKETRTYACGTGDLILAELQYLGVHWSPSGLPDDGERPSSIPDKTNESKILYARIFCLLTMQREPVPLSLVLGRYSEAGAF